MKSKHYLLLCLVPLSEAKALFYNSDMRVSWFLFSDNKRYLCNVVEDYSNVLTFAVLLYQLAFSQIDELTKRISLFLFIVNALDLLHLGLMDLQYLIILKIFLSVIVTAFICTQLKPR